MLKKFLIGLLLLVVGLPLLALIWPEKRYKLYQVDADYQAQVDAYHVPDMPPDWQWKEFSASDGTRLRWGETGNRTAAKASFIFVPGYTATLDMYGEHFDILARMGYHVMGLDMRGQGGSQRHREKQPEKLWVEDFSVYGEDVRGWIDHLGMPDDRKLILSGSSFGGHVVTRATGDLDLPVDGLFLLAPAFEPISNEYTMDEAIALMDKFRKLGKAERYVVGETDWRPDQLDFTKASDCSSYPKRAYLKDTIYVRKPEQRVGGITNQWGAEFFESTQYLNRPEFYAKLGLPVTIITAETDKFIVNEENRKACAEHIKQCREVIIPETGHCLTQENDAVLEQIMGEVDLLLERVTSER